MGTEEGALPGWPFRAVGGFGSGGGFSASQAAEDLQKLDVEKEAGEATQIEAIELEKGTTRATQLRSMRKDTVDLLRDVPVDGPIPAELRERALTLRKRIGPFMGASEAARRMSGALAELLAREVAEGGSGPSGACAAPAPEGGGGEPRARIVGRATEVLLGGARQQYFLLFQPPRFYDWLTEEGMRADSELSAVLDAYSGEKGDDPSGDGWVVAVVRARGPTFRREYRVRWKVEPQTPIKYAEARDYGWLLKHQLVNPALAGAFERRQRGEDDSDGGARATAVAARATRPRSATPACRPP